MEERDDEDVQSITLENTVASNHINDEDVQSVTTLEDYVTLDHTYASPQKCKYQNSLKHTNLTDLPSTSYDEPIVIIIPPAQSLQPT